jgi:hypothetical protein
MTAENKRTLADYFARHGKILTSARQEKNERGQEIFQSTFYPQTCRSTKKSAWTKE